MAKPRCGVLPQITDPPWEVPRKRKNRGRKQDHYYDPSSENFVWRSGGEISTSNKYGLFNSEDTRLNPDWSDLNAEKNILVNQEMNTDSSQENEDLYIGMLALNRSYQEFMETKSKYLDIINHCMYTNKNCSGYFLDLITLYDDIKCNVSKCNNYPNYYLFKNDEKHLKLLSYSLSKYNNKYFDDMSFAYKVGIKWSNEIHKNSGLPMYLYPHRKTQSLRGSGIGIPEDLNIGSGHKNLKNYRDYKQTLRDTGIGISEVLKKANHNASQSSRGSGIGTSEEMNTNKSPEDSRIGIQRGSGHKNLKNYRKYRQTLGDTGIGNPEVLNEQNILVDSRKRSRKRSKRRKKNNITPTREKILKPRIKLFHNPEEEGMDLGKIPLDTDLEVLLVNSRKVDAPKIQTIVEDFIRDKKYTTIFCLTETKVEGHDFQPDGIKIFSKHRRKKMEKMGGGLALGYAEKANVELEEIKVRNNDILAVEGKIHNKKFRIVLCYFDSSKLLKGKDFNRNRSLQKQIEKLMEVETDTSLLVLGDFNGRLKKLEPAIRTDANGRMLESWVEKFNMHHLNTLDTCSGTYTFNSLNGRSAIDHILTNKILYEKHIEMVIDEDRLMLEISDHNLVRAWFHIGNSNYAKASKKAVKEITWISREQDRIHLCVNNFRSKVGKKISFKGCMSKIKTSVEYAMRRRKRIKPGGKKILTLKAAPWVDEELIMNIKFRSKFSREWRYARKRKESEEMLEKYKQRYLKQKSRTAIMTGDKKSLWEDKKIEETWNDSKTFWKMIGELLGKNKGMTEEAYIFTEQGEKKEIMTCRREFMENWTKQVYQKLKKADFSFWTDENIGMKKEMEKELNEENSGIMKNPIITEKELVDTINNMKNNKASGVDNIPAETMKALMKDSISRQYILKCFNKAITEEVHQDWLVSRTTMIPKNNKPKILEHRPIAVTVNSNKIICTILRKKIEDFLIEKEIGYSNQFGFTEGGRVEHCMFMIDYITNMSYEKRGKRNRPLYLAFIDFKKAYDSIDRKKLIEVLIEYKINPQIIDLIVQMYHNDHTIIKLGNMKEKVEVTGGIRQGCCISTLLFKMVTFKIIEELRKEKRYKIGEFEDNSIWLADDATLIAENLETLKKLLDCLSRAGGEYGLEINEKKTKIMKVKGPNNNEQIEGYEMVQEARYLGITVGGRGRNIFERENEDFLAKAERKVNLLMAEVRKSADKAVVGKAIWKLMCIPAILFGRAVVPTCASRIEGLQRLENRVWRYLLDIGGYSTIDALRGEMGASMVKSRVMETTLQYVRSTMNSEFDDIKKLMQHTIDTGKGRWYSNVNSYREVLNITWEELYGMTKEELKRRVRIYDTEVWKLNLINKTTLKYYAEGKTGIGYDYCYRNNINSTYLARARVNSLKLEEAKGRGNPYYNRECKLCRQGEENIVHFTTVCKALEDKRDYNLLNRDVEDPKKRMIELLFKQKDHQGVGRMIKSLWFRRKALLKYKEETEKRRKERKLSPTGICRSDPGPMRNSHTPMRRRSRGKSVLKG